MPAIGRNIDLRGHIEVLLENTVIDKKTRHCAKEREDCRGKAAVLAWRTKRGNTTDLIYSAVPKHRTLPIDVDGNYMWITCENFTLDPSDIEGL